MSVFKYDKDSDGIVTVTMDMTGQSANTMNERFVPAWDETLTRLRAEENLTGVVIASAKKTFFLRQQKRPRKRRHVQERAVRICGHGPGWCSYDRYRLRQERL